VDVILEVLDTYSKQSKNYDLGCCIYPTAPFISTEMLQNANNLLLEKNYETVFPVVQFDYPIQRSLQKDEQNKVSMVWPEFLLSRSQDLPARYHDCGMFYWFKSQQLYSSKRLFTENSGSIVVSPLECHDIDSPTDWHMAELKYQYLKTLNNS
jgi:N-acylneuraminate cytidylyltransferase